MEIPPARIWQQCKKALQNRIPTQPFNTWIRPVELVEFSPSVESPTITLGVRDDFHRDWVDRHYGQFLRDAIAGIAGGSPIVEYRIVELRKRKEEPNLFSDMEAENEMETGTAAEPNRNGLPHSPEFFQPSRQAPTSRALGGPPPITANRETVASPLPRTLNPRYTFDSFIEADCNRLARSAGIAVADKPGGTSFNPFLIYGKVGLGKTHLAHAIGNYILVRNPRLRVLYVTSEAFTNFFVRAIQKNTLSEFTDTFRRIDVLIVDDICSMICTSVGNKSSCAQTGARRK